MNSRRLLIALSLPLLVWGAVPALGAPAPGTDSKVTVGSPAGSFPRNKQNEPAVGVARSAADPTLLAAGANEEIDNAPCHRTSCAFTPGVGDSGIYFSMDGGGSWVQPTYSGWSARTGRPQVGPIGTVPGYYEKGLVSDGDPALAFGPVKGPGGFSWSNGSRLYYASLASAFPGTNSLAGQEAIAVSRTDDVRAAAAGDAAAWKAPVIASRHLRTDVFSDKEAIWADNAESSPHFGNAYVCWTSFRGVSNAPLVVARSSDGGDSWSAAVRVVAAQGTAFTGPSFCTVRTDSQGVVYVFYENGTAQGLAQQMMSRSTDGGQSFDPPRPVADVTLPGALDPAHVAVGDPRFTMDGVAGARADAGLSVDIANGAPSGTDASNEMVMTWADGRRGLNREQALAQLSTDGGSSWTAPVSAAGDRDRPFFPAVGISPDGKDVYLTYSAFLAPWQGRTRAPRPLQGVVRHADAGLAGWTSLHRGAIGDARGSSQNDLTSEFLGDYNYAAATRTGVAAVWNDVRDAANCPAVDAYRQSLTLANHLPKPAAGTACPSRFGNSDIYGGVFAAPAP